MGSYTFTGCLFEQRGSVEKPAERLGWVNKDANTNIDRGLSQVKSTTIKGGSIPDVQVSVIELADT